MNWRSALWLRVASGLLLALTWSGGCAAPARSLATGTPARAQVNEPAPADSRVALAAALDAIFDDPQYANAFWGVRVEKLDGTVLYDRCGHKGFLPASNLKVITSAAALDLLGADFTYSTRLEAVGDLHTDGSMAAGGGTSTVGAKATGAGTAAKGAVVTGGGTAAEGEAVTDGVLRGDLLIVGSGDPSLGAWHPDESRDSRAVLATWAGAVAAAGIHTITGDIVGDGRCFSADYYGPDWTYSDLPYWYAAGVSGLALEENAFRCLIKPGPAVGDPGVITLTPPTSYVTIVNDTRTVDAGTNSTADGVPYQTEGNTKRFVGTIALDNPGKKERGSVWDGAAYAAHLFKEELERQGVTVGGRAVNIRSLADPRRLDGAPADRRRVLATSTSPPLGELVKEINKISHNFFADQILCTVGLHCGAADGSAAGVDSHLAGARKPASPADSGTNGSGSVPLAFPASGAVDGSREGSFTSGAQAVQAWLERIGVPQAGALQMSDGSGLARSNLVQPRQMCHVLRHMRRADAAGQAFYASLAIGGVDGLLTKRLTDPAVRGKVRAKTGYISNVRCLSGYVLAADGEELVFALMCNQYTVPTAQVNASQDRACAVLAALQWGRY